MATLGKLATRLKAPLKSLMPRGSDAEEPADSEELGVASEIAAEDPSPAPEILSDSVDWRALVDRVQKGDDAGMADLYRLFAKGIRFYLCRQLGAQEID